MCERSGSPDHFAAAKVKPLQALCRLHKFCAGTPRQDATSILGRGAGRRRPRNARTQSMRAVGPPVPHARLFSVNRAALTWREKQRRALHAAREEKQRLRSSKIPAIEVFCEVDKRHDDEGGETDLARVLTFSAACRSNL